MADATEKLEIHLHRLTRLLGVEIESTQVRQLLQRLGFDVLQEDADRLTLESTHAISSLRRREIDVIEAVARAYGFEAIRAQWPVGGTSVGCRDRLEEFQDRLRRTLVGLGCHEALNVGLLSDADSFSDEKTVRLRRRRLWLRRTLLTELLRNIQHNQKAGVDGIRLFELGKVFQIEEGTVRERLMLGLALAGRAKVALAGPAQIYTWRDLKGLIESLLLELGLRNFTFERAGDGLWFDPRRSLAVKAKEEPLGHLGAPREELAARFGVLSERVLLAELDLERIYSRLLTLSTPVWSELKPKVAPAYPYVRRRLLVNAPAETKESAVRWVLEGEKCVEEVFLSELEPQRHRKIFRYEITFRDWNQSLSDADVAEMLARLTRRLAKELGADVQVQRALCL
jgi:phenylalanyl-tRNA synthetase beta chain